MCVSLSPAVLTGLIGCLSVRVCLQVSAALRKLAAQLRDTDAPSTSDSAAAAAASKGSSDSDSETEVVDSTAEHSPTPHSKQRRHQPGVVEQLQHRRSAQLQPTVLRLVKELLTQGGGKTD